MKREVTNSLANSCEILTEASGAGGGNFATSRRAGEGRAVGKI